MLKAWKINTTPGKALMIVGFRALGLRAYGFQDLLVGAATWCSPWLWGYRWGYKGLDFPTFKGPAESKPDNRNSFATPGILHSTATLESYSPATALAVRLRLSKTRHFFFFLLLSFRGWACRLQRRHHFHLFGLRRLCRAGRSEMNRSSSRSVPLRV